MKILICTTVVPSGKKTGSEIASQSFIDAMRADGHHVDVLGYRRPNDLRPLAVWEHLVSERHIESAESLSNVALWLGRAFLKGTPYSCQKYVSIEYSIQVQALMHKRYDCVVIDHAQMGFLLKLLSSLDLPLIFIAHNVEEQIYSGLAAAKTGIKRALYRREARLIAALETMLAQTAQQVWTLTKADENHFSARGARYASTFCVPSALVPENPTDAEVSSSPELSWDIGMIGTWSWQANAEGLRWFIDQVLPKLPSNVKIGIAGKGADWLNSFAPRIHCLGFVENASTFLASCKVVCVPSIAGGGLQIKTLDAIAAGRPTVVTSFALRGIEGVPETVQVADDATAFAARLVAALALEPAQSSYAARSWVTNRLAMFRAAVKESIVRLAQNE